MPEATGLPAGTPAWSGTAVLADRGRVVHEESAGSADGPGSTPCGPRLRFQAASVGKQVLSVVALALQERDRLHVAEPIARWLPGLPRGFGAITLHHLLTHTAGTGHWADLPGWGPGAGPPAADALPALTVEAGLATAPGTSWRYSGPGFALAARVLEAAAGERYRDLVAGLVLVPAGMASTTSGRFPPGWADAAAGHRGGHRVPVDPGWTRIPGSGDLWTTAEDLLRYARALRSGRLLDPGTAAALWEPHVRLPVPATTASTTADAYGCGTFLGRVGGRPAWFVPGDNPGYRSLLAHPRGGDADLVVLSNDEGPGLDDAVGRALRPFADPAGPGVSAR
ncbi:serine hydrolase domain-containing protein [Kineococcus sp. SYSU DK002]|uniref:serine hydrolase domain-containing protein n=1 Tax=Kineococcus sp. SYSU DK002 TaxID=3383123 RepID=UPI003D7E71EB